MNIEELTNIKVTKDSLPAIREAIIEYSKHSREHIELETKMLAGYMAVLNTLDEKWSQPLPQINYKYGH